MKNKLEEPEELEKWERINMEENNIILFEEKSLEVMKKLKDLKTEKDRLDKIDEE